MHNVYNASEVFYLWDINKQKLSLIGNRMDLVHKIAQSYYQHYFYDIALDLENSILDNYACNENDYQAGRGLQIFDGLNRCINPKEFEKEAYALYLKLYKNKKYSFKPKTYKGVFRYSPVEGIHNYNGGPYAKNRCITRIKRMHANPEYKEFNRRSKKNVDEWINFKLRCVQRSWKEQRKHQWKDVA